MKKILGLLLFAVAIQAKAQTVPATKTNTTVLKTIDTASYGFGVSLGGNLKNSGVKDLNFELVFKGIKDAYGDVALQFKNEETQAAIMKVFELLSKEKYAAKLAENDAFLAKNKLVEGVKTTASGIQYQVLREGSGPNPSAQDTVTVHYLGKLSNDEKFDSSYDRNEPASFPLSRVIPGWSESVMLMNKGAHYRFWIPSDLGYGERGAGESIPPHSVLIFEIELLDIKPKI